jgi:hypothetical protein
LHWHKFLQQNTLILNAEYCNKLKPNTPMNYFRPSQLKIIPERQLHRI